MTMLDVTVLGRLPAGFRKNDVTKLASAAWKRGGGRGVAEASFTVIDDRRMRRLNREHRGKDKTTDVLSFGQPSPQRSTRKAPKGLPMPKGAVPQLGDVFISLPQVRRQAKAVDRSVREEFALMIVHGVLHLMGHDHESLAQEQRMFGLQHDILLKEGYF